MVQFVSFMARDKASPEEVAKSVFAMLDASGDGEVSILRTT